MDWLRRRRRRASWLTSAALIHVLLLFFKWLGRQIWPCERCAEPHLGVRVRREQPDQFCASVATTAQHQHAELTMALGGRSGEAPAARRRRASCRCELCREPWAQAAAHSAMHQLPGMLRAAPSIVARRMADSQLSTHSPRLQVPQLQRTHRSGGRLRLVDWLHIQ